MERLVSELAPDPAIFTRHLSLVQDFVRSQPGAHAALMTEAKQDPETLTMSIVALGAMLLDVAAEAYKITPESMLERIAVGVESIINEEPEQPAY